MRTLGRFSFAGYLIGVIAAALLVRDLDMIGGTDRFVPFCLGIAMFSICMVPVAVGRLKDMGRSPALAALELVPGVNVIFCLICLTEPGQLAAQGPAGWNNITWRVAPCILAVLYIFGRAYA